MVVCVIDQAGYGATAAAPVVRDIFNYLATHPVTPAAVPPGQQVIQSDQPVSLPTAPAITTTTTTTTAATGTATTGNSGHGTGGTNG